MPATETVYGLTSNIPGVIYATAGSGVYVSTNQGASWTHISDGIPGIASPHTTWSYPQKPQILFTATGSNGIYRSINGGLTWSPINDGLGAVRARGFQVFTGADGAHLYAATENGLWHALHTNDVIPPVAKPKWRKVTDQGLITQGSTNTIMWSLTSPVIPGAGGAFGLIAGTQSNGGYFLPFSPPNSTCPVNNPTDTANCPQITGTKQVGQTLTATTGSWTGTETIDKEFQWQLCTTADPGSCADIEGETEQTLVIPESAQGDRYRVFVTATNPSPTFGLIKRRSVLTAAVSSAPSSMPGYNQTSSPSIDVLPPGSQFSPEVGDQVYADYGTTPNVNSDGWFNPKATSWSYEWLRCKQGGDDCTEIPGATARTYTLAPADGTGTVRVRVKGTNNAGSTELTSGPSYYVISQPATIAAPLLIDGAAQSQAPSLSGTPYVGETLAGSVGGWVDPTTDFERRWLQCDAGGASCTVIRKVASTEAEEGSTYVLRAEDRGYTIRMRVKADVNGDLTPDGLDNYLPKAVEVDTPATAVVTDRPVPTTPGTGGGGGDAGPGGGAADTTAPSLASPTLSKKSIVPGKAVNVGVFASEAGTMRIVITKPASGRKVKGACKPLTKKNRKAKKCTYQKVVTTITRPASAGANSFKFDGKVGKKKLARGSYRMTIVVTDASGNPSAPVVLAFKIVKK